VEGRDNCFVGYGSLGPDIKRADAKNKSGEPPKGHSKPLFPILSVQTLRVRRRRDYSKESKSGMLLKKSIPKRCDKPLIEFYRQGIPPYHRSGLVAI